jgi:ribose/xylose/arabinose/galactoside ABC-type transport system permease subunit
MIPRSERLRRLLAPPVGPVLGLALLLTANVLFTPGFASGSTLRNVLLQVAPTMLVATGMTFVIASGGIDLSVGSTMAIASAAAATHLEHGAGFAVALGLFAGAAVGLLNGAVTAIGGVQPIIVTLATLIAGRGFAQVISEGGQLISFSDRAFQSLGQGSIGPVPMQVLLMSLALLAGFVVLRLTAFGRYVLAVGGSERAARLAGVHVRGTKTAVYCISGIAAAVAGLIETARLGASDAARVGLNVELDAISAVVIGGTALQGGTATMVGTAAGALIIQTIMTAFNMLSVPFSWSLVVKASVILAIVWLQRPKAA